MGAAPGPACYGLGGREATTTDALLLLGYLSPTAFLDGRRTLDSSAAAEAVQRTVAGPLGVPVADAAGRIADAAFDQVAKLAADTAAEIGWDPADATLYAFGGNGPLFATAVAERLGIRTVRLFGLAHVLSAYGSAISDVVHVYESAVVGNETEQAITERLRAEAERDLRGEGFDPDSADYRVETRDAEHGALVRLTASVELPRVQAPDLPGTGTATPSGERGGRATYDWASLAGARIEGPSLVDGGSFTWWIGPGWSASIDTHGDAAVRTGGGN
jgi:N-methylhydantoinase A/oxoprolinase/acetone carboxylase beta subunit